MIFCSRRDTLGLNNFASRSELLDQLQIQQMVERHFNRIRSGCFYRTLQFPLHFRAAEMIRQPEILSPDEFQLRLAYLEELISTLKIGKMENNQSAH